MLEWWVRTLSVLLLLKYTNHLFFMKYIVTILIILILGVGGYMLLTDNSTEDIPGNGAATTTDQVDGTDDNGTSTDDDGDNAVGADSPETIGQSAGGHAIEAYHFGSGETEILFVSGIHGGYSWNTALLGHEIIDWLDANQDTIPENVRVTVIPVLNPDGLNETVGTTDGNFSASDVPSQEATISGRFNANEVDINRNFDCNWQSQGKWQSTTVDAGSAAFSEPEARALRGYVQANNPAVAVAYYSAAGGVYTSSCNGSASSETRSLMNTYANASGYPAAGEFTAYEVTGDAVDWMSKVGVTGISVLLETHDQVEWQKNKAGIEAVIQRYAQ